jgi:hypothetical protein
MEIQTMEWGNRAQMSEMFPHTQKSNHVPRKKQPINKAHEKGNNHSAKSQVTPYNSGPNPISAQQRWHSCVAQQPLLPLAMY